MVEEEAKSLLESSQGEAKQVSENADEIKKVIAEIEDQLEENEKSILRIGSARGCGLNRCFCQQTTEYLTWMN